MDSAGPNWLIAGEAAALVDPMTSNGVTAALRHAAEAAALVLKFRARGELPRGARKAYSSRIVQTAKFFNQGIEKTIYEPRVRNRIGLSSAGTVYTSPAWSMNVVYARLRPAGMFSTFLLGTMLGFFRTSASILYWCCGLLKPAVPGASTELDNHDVRLTTSNFLLSPVWKTPVPTAHPVQVRPYKAAKCLRPKQHR